VHLGPQGAQHPRFGLWVFSVKMSKQLLVRKVKQTRTIISHAITDARNKEVSTEVAVMALMKGQATKKIIRGL
jgi:hypothetical protein